MGDDALQHVINHLTEFVRQQDEPVVGARIGLELSRKFPDFNRERYGYTSLTDLLDRAAPELSIVGQSGADFRWSADAELGRLEGTSPDEASPGAFWPATPASMRISRFSARCFRRGDPRHRAGLRVCVPTAHGDEQKLARERSRLGFDPIAESFRLSHKVNVPKSAKRVREELGADDEILRVTSVDSLHRHGECCGLQAFIDAIGEHLVSRAT